MTPGKVLRSNNWEATDPLRPVMELDSLKMVAERPDEGGCVLTGFQVLPFTRFAAVFLVEDCSIKFASISLAFCSALVSRQEASNSEPTLVRDHSPEGVLSSAWFYCKATR